MEIGADAEVVVDARLLDTGTPAPKPGVVYVVSLMHYEILKVVRGEYAHPSIYVGHHLPDLTAAQMRVGAVHRLYLTRRFPEHASVLDSFQNVVSKATPFFCSSFETIG